MSFTIPSGVTTFYTTYPSALSVFVDQDGANMYLNHFEKKAKEEAARNVKKLYEVDSGNTIDRVYPTTFLYKGQYDLSQGAVDTVTIGGTATTINSADPATIVTAINAALSSAGVVATPVEQTTNGNSLTLEFITSSDTTIVLADTNAVNYSFQQIFN